MSGHGAPLKNMVGTRVGMLVLDKELPSDSERRRCWLCKCDCGGEIVINSAQLRRQVPDNCGCQKKCTRLNLTGQTFGKLTVLGLSDKRGPRGKRTVPLWECKCECGEICYKTTDTLRNEEESMCAKCAAKRDPVYARAAAGFTDGTQISKLKSTKPSKASKTGVRGVSYIERDDLWRAHIGFKGQKIKLGYFHNFTDAVKARRRAEEEYYGRFLQEYEGFSDK